MSEEDDRQRMYRAYDTVRADIPSLVAVSDEDGALQLLQIVLLQIVDKSATAPTIKELAGLVRRSVSQTSRLVEQLVRRGLVERVQVDEDRRLKRVRVTDKGLAVMRRMNQIRADATLKLWEHLTPEERAAVLYGIELMAKAAERMRHEGR